MKAYFYILDIYIYIMNDKYVTESTDWDQNPAVKVLVDC